MMEHSIKFPLPFGIHLGFVIVSVILLILCYSKKKHKYELYMLIGVASTMLVYIADTDPVFYILGLEEIILFIMTVVDMSKVSREERAREKYLKEHQAAAENAKPEMESIQLPENTDNSDNEGDK